MYPLKGLPASGVVVGVAEELPEVDVGPVDVVRVVVEVEVGRVEVLLLLGLPPPPLPPGLWKKRA